MSGRIETIASKDNSSKWSKNETSIVRSAGVDIGDDLEAGGVKTAGTVTIITSKKAGAIGVSGLQEDDNNDYTG